VHEPNLSPRGVGAPPPEATRYSNVRSDSRALLSSSDVSDHGLSVARQGTPECDSLGAVLRGSMNGGARRTLFAGTETPTYTVRRGRGLLVAFVLHVLALTPFFVSTIHVESKLTPSMEAVGVTFVMAPLRGIGSPPPAPTPAPEPEPKPDRTEPQPEVLKPMEPEPAIENKSLIAESLAPLTAPPTLDVPRRPVLPIASLTPAGTARGVSAAQREPERGMGNGGVGDDPFPPAVGSDLLPPAIGAPSGQSNWAGLVLGRLEQFRRYPAAARRSRQEGICYVRFTIDREGHVLDSSLERTSGHESLDREAVALVRRADPLPTPPPELEGETVTLTVPVEFFLKR
jgi:protein TonB